MLILIHQEVTSLFLNKAKANKKSFSLKNILVPGNAKRKKSDDEDDELDDRLEDEDYDLIEENLGVKVERVIERN